MKSPEGTPSSSRREASAEDSTLAPAAAPELTLSYHPGGQAGNALPRQLPCPFGRYQLRKLLGQGGMGAVYLAHDAQLDRPVALKMPLLSAADGAQILARFYREARAAALLRHPHVCPIHDVGEIDGQPYLTMAFIEGKSLAAFARARPLTPRQSAALLRKLALALQEAHSHGVIHRDLKPANIMIDTRGEPMVMDFGLARRARPGDPQLTQRGDVLGTPAYMSPEQVGGNVDAIGPACDIYSLGVILYELLTGRLPFTGDPMAVLSQVLLDEPPPPAQLRPDLDPALEAICLGAMAKKIDDRYSSMAALAAALQSYLRGAAAPAAPTPRPTAPSQRSPLPWIIGGSAALGLLVGVIALLAWSRAPAHPESAPAGTPPVDRQIQQAPGTPAHAPASDFVPLFNGIDLSHWSAASGDPTVWRVRDGAMICTVTDPPRQRGWLLTRRDYTDFLLQLEFQLSAGASSGVALRTWPGAVKPLEIEIKDDTFPAYAGLDASEHTGTLFHVAGQPAQLQPVGQWNRMEIELRGWSLPVAVNDRETLRLSLLEDRVFRYLEGAPPASGRLGLQHGQGSVRFRKVEVKDLSRTPEAPGQEENP
jgi:serine/threonine protein kinase